MVNFKNKLKEKQLEKKTDPIELYKTLDRKSVAGPLRPAQESILSQWFDFHKDDRDLIVKLHTGEGKTLIGLLILQSRINMGEGPCLYVCPNRYLVEQVRLEAEKFGIQHEILLDEHELNHDFLSGNKILITHVQKVFNGKSIFGIGTASTKVGTIILDDSHTCIDVIKSSFTVKISKKNENLYQKILNLFEDDLIDQGEGSFLDIKDGNYSTLMTVPYWAWIEKKSSLLKILAEHKDEQCIKYSWDLIKDSIEKYDCYITGNKIEISPYNIETKKFGVFEHAKHRILMSATTQDDSFFIKGLNFNINSVRNPLRNQEQPWSGEKMIILPSLIDDSLDRQLIITELMKIEQNNFGIVSIVPNTKKTKIYENQGGIIVNASNIFNEIDKLKKGVFTQVVVFNNRYDGIDLPDESCRILVIDSKPYFENLCDQYEEMCRPDSDIVNKKIAQKIEQGLGRGVRGEKDYCVILIIGNDIVNFMRNKKTREYFSEQTRKQIDIGLEISKFAQEDTATQEPSNSLCELIVQCIRRDEGWKAYYLDEMNKMKEDTNSLKIYDILGEEKQIEDCFMQGEYAQAFGLMQSFIDKHQEMSNYDKGWYLQQLARYSYYSDKTKFNEIQKSAFRLNNELLKPRNGINYVRVSYVDCNRLAKIREFLNKFEDYQELMLSINEILENLSFAVDHEKFEDSLQKVGELFGFISQRPDKEIKKGPDNLWCCTNNEYMIFECKNEVLDTREAIKKSEVGQMNNHCGWFESEYGTEVKVSRFMIIPIKKIEYSTNFTHEVKIIRKSGLRKLKNVVKDFVHELNPYDLGNITDEKLQEIIDRNELYPEKFKVDFSEDYIQEIKR